MWTRGEEQAAVNQGGWQVAVENEGKRKAADTDKGGWQAMWTREDRRQWGKGGWRLGNRYRGMAEEKEEGDDG